MGFVNKGNFIILLQEFKRGKYIEAIKRVELGLVNKVVEKLGAGGEPPILANQPPLLAYGWLDRSLKIK